jgi:hypothetical protein
MANLDKSNVVNGNIISASDITALYDTFTGVNTANNIDILGSNNNFAGTASKADNLRYTNGSSNHEYPVVFVTGSAQYKTAYVDSNDKITYNPSTNLLTVTASLANTGSRSITSETADNLDDFGIIDPTGNPGTLTRPRPIAVTVQFPSGGSGSIDLAIMTPPIATAASTLGQDIFVVGQTLVAPNQINTADTLEINYTAPTLFAVTSSNNTAFGAILTGWTTA